MDEALREGVCEPGTESDDEVRASRVKVVGSRTGVSVGDSVMGENAPGTERRIGCGDISDGEESLGGFCSGASRDFELLATVLDFERDDVGADSGIGSEPLIYLPKAFLLGWVFGGALGCLVMQRVTEATERLGGGG